MILKKLNVGSLATNTYIFGFSVTKEVVIIDPGDEANKIIDSIDKLKSKPIAVLLTHGHFDHTFAVGKVQRFFKIPLMFNKKEFDSGIYNLLDLLIIEIFN